MVVGLSFRIYTALFGALALCANASLRDGRPHANMMPPPSIPSVPPTTGAPVITKRGNLIPPYNTIYYFDQLIDHKKPALGTFKQRYYHTWEFYEPGGPIILSTPGETPITYGSGYSQYLTNKTLHGAMAQSTNGSVILLEHRFFGLSNPRPDLSSESLKLLTIEQSIEDLVYFAENVVLPQPNGHRLKPTQAPWILVGGSYSAALFSWAMVDKPGVFFAGFASSAVVEAIHDFWQYQEPIREHMPKNCSADFQAVVAHVDSVLQGNNKAAIEKIKANFGFESLDHVEDVAGALRNHLWDWQGLQPISGNDTAFRKFCDALEVKDGRVAPESGWGLEHALPTLGAYWKNSYYEYLCDGKTPLECLGTYDPTADYWTNISVDNKIRSWFWFVCNEVGWFQSAAPASKPTLISRLIPADYDLRQCQLMFPGVFTPSKVIDVEKLNKRYHGWNLQVDRLFLTSAHRDPWRDATVFAPGIRESRVSTPLRPNLIGEGFHCSEFKLSNGDANPGVRDRQKQVISAMVRWLPDFKPADGGAARLAWNSSREVDVTSEVETVEGQRETLGKPINAWFKEF